MNYLNGRYGKAIAKLNIGSIYQKTLRHNLQKIRQASVLALGNIFCSTSEAIDYIFKNSGSVFSTILEMIQNDTHFKVFIYRSLIEFKS